MLRQVDVLRVVEICIRRVEDGVDHPRFQVQEHSTGDVVLIISLGEMFIKKRKKEDEMEEICRAVKKILAAFKSFKYATITPSSGKRLFCMCVTKKGG